MGILLSEQAVCVNSCKGWSHSSVIPIQVPVPVCRHRRLGMATQFSVPPRRIAACSHAHRMRYRFLDDVERESYFVDLNFDIMNSRTLDLFLTILRRLDYAIHEHDSLAMQAFRPRNHVLRDDAFLFGEYALYGRHLLAQNEENYFRAWASHSMSVNGMVNCEAGPSLPVGLEWWILALN
jgi:hypothetical protein